MFPRNLHILKPEKHKNITLHSTPWRIKVVSIRDPSSPQISPSVPTWLTAAHVHRSPGTITRMLWQPVASTALHRHQMLCVLTLKGGVRPPKRAQTASPFPWQTLTPDWGWHALHISTPMAAFTALRTSMKEIALFVSRVPWASNNIAWLIIFVLRWFYVIVWDLIKLF